jgi:CRP-like cAMP-binding protein
MSGGILDALLRKLRARDEVSDHEQAILERGISEVRELPADALVVKAGVELTHSTLLSSGFICRYKDLADGQRQIMELHVGGDFLDLHGFLLKRLEHNVATMTPATIALIPHERVREITETEPHLARMLWFSTLLDAAIHRERILSIGRRSALERIAHLACELYLRLEVAGLASDLRYPLPLTQADLADATGLTPVHVNRMLRELRNDGLMTFRGGEVVIHDWERLKRRAGFSPAYLYLEQRPR